MVSFQYAPFRKALKSNALFSLPLMAGQIGQMLFGIGDTIVAGRYSSLALGVLGVANGLFAPLIIMGAGFLGAISPLIAIEISQKRGLQHNLGSILWLCGLLSLLFFAFTKTLNLLVPTFSFAPEMVPGIQTYLGLVAYSIPGFIFYQGIKEFLQAHHITKIPNLMVFFFNILNIILNFVLMFGWGGLPELGVKGAAIATVVTRNLMGVTLFLYALKVHKSVDLRLDKGLFEEFFKLGLPLSGGAVLEGLIFSVVTLLIGRMDVISSASHNIVLTLASFTFMVPLALSSTAGVKVAESWGNGRHEEVKYNAISTVTLSSLFMSASALCYWFVPDMVSGLLTNDPVLIEKCRSLLFIVAFFQVPDGLQVTLWGILRGLKVAKLPFILVFIGHYLIGLPIGCYFAFVKNMQAGGLWIGLTVGLCLMAISLSLVAIHRYRNLPALAQPASV